MQKTRTVHVTVEFECTSNTRTPWINTAIFAAEDGTEFVLDRCHTEYSFNPETGEQPMEWRDVYLWDGEDENYDIPENLIKNATLKELEVEDDAPEDYEISCTGCWINDENGNSYEVKVA